MSSRTSRTKSRLLAISFCLVSLAGSPFIGCAKKDSATVIAGSVTLNGAPLSSGQIRFVAEDGKTPTAGAPITNGAFLAQVAPGAKKVEINAPKVVGKKKMYETADSPTVDVVEELLPPKYNTRTELKLSVAGDDQKHDFDLTTK